MRSEGVAEKLNYFERYLETFAFAKFSRFLHPFPHLGSVRKYLETFASVWKKSQIRPFRSGSPFPSPRLTKQRRYLIIVVLFNADKASFIHL